MKNNNDDLTNIKFVTKEKIGEFEKSQEKEINQQINYNNNSPNKLISIKDLQQNPKEKLIINSRNFSAYFSTVSDLSGTAIEQDNVDILMI